MKLSATFLTLLPLALASPLFPTSTKPSNNQLARIEARAPVPVPSVATQRGSAETTTPVVREEWDSDGSLDSDGSNDTDTDEKLNDGSNDTDTDENMDDGSNDTDENMDDGSNDTDTEENTNDGSHDPDSNMNDGSHDTDDDSSNDTQPEKPNGTNDESKNSGKDDKDEPGTPPPPAPKGNNTVPDEDPDSGVSGRAVSWGVLGVSGVVVVVLGLL